MWKFCGWNVFPHLFLFHSSIFPRVTFPGLITFIEFAGIRESPEETAAWERGQVSFCSLMETVGLTIYLFKKKRGGQRTNTESPTSSLFCSSYLGRMEIAGLCLHISSRNCFQLLVISLPLDSIEGCVCPTQAEKQEGLISENLITTALSKYLKTLPAPLHTPHQILMLKKKLQIFLWEKSLQLPV